MQKMLFLSNKEILEIHESIIAKSGGSTGIRDLKLLDSAASQPKATFGGTFVHADIYEMAAAYFFHIIKNHAFVDGNKRTGLITTLSFLKLNYYKIKLTKAQLYKIAINVAASKISKSDLIKIFKKFITKNPQK